MGMRWALALLFVASPGCMLVFEVAAPRDESEVSPSRALALSYPELSSTLPYTLARNSAPAQLDPEVDGDLELFEIAPGLPAGLSFDAQTGRITGVPSAIIAETAFTVTAKRTSDAAEVSVVIRLETADFEVDSDLNTGDTAPGDGSCDDGSGKCTLRAAIQESNALAGTQKIYVPLEVHTGGVPFSVTSALSLLGNPLSEVDMLDGDHVSRILSVSASLAQVTLKNLHLRRGRDATGGGCLTVSGARMTILSSRFEQCEALGGGGSGGAVFINGGGAELSIEGSVFLNNIASRGGAVEVYLGVPAVIRDSTFVGNSSVLGGGGGGVCFIGAGLTVERSSFVENTTLGYGGGIFLHNSATGGVNVSNSYFEDNEALRGGAFAMTTNSIPTLTQNTFYKNKATDPTTSQVFGGALFLAGGMPGPRLSLANNHFYRNEDGGVQSTCRNVSSGSIVSLHGNVGDFSGFGAECSIVSGDVNAEVDLLVRATSASGLIYRSVAPATALEGTGLQANCPSVDLLGNPRPPGGNCTAGALEP